MREDTFKNGNKIGYLQTSAMLTERSIEVIISSLLELKIYGFKHYLLKLISDFSYEPIDVQQSIIWSTLNLKGYFLEKNNKKKFEMYLLL